MTSTPGFELATFAAPDLSDDGFLDGRLRILQPRTGYRAAGDPVLLAAAVAAIPGQRVLELGCGAGVASLCLGWRVAGLALTGLERQPAYGDLARQNAARNAIAMTVVDGDLSAMPPGLAGQCFDHVIANPPWFAAGSGSAAHDIGREAAQRIATPLAVWIDAGLRRLSPGGWLTVIQTVAHLPELLAAARDRAGDITVLPLAARAGAPAGRIVMRARKGARGPFALLAPFVLHDGTAHDGDRDSATAAARAILRDGAPLPFAPAGD